MARIYKTADLGEAHVRVALVQARGEADLLVQRVHSWGLAIGDERWFITGDKQAASTWVYFCSVGMAEVKICFVDHDFEAGWQKPSRYKNRFR